MIAEPMAWSTLLGSLALALWPMWVILAACGVLAVFRPVTCGHQYNAATYPDLRCERHPKHADDLHVGTVSDGTAYGWTA